MTPDVLLVAKTSVDYHNLLKAVKALVGQTISKATDSNNLSGISAFICSLAELSDDNRDHLNILRNAGDLLDHIQYSFLLVAERDLFYLILRKTGLYYTDPVESIRNGIYVGIISGSLVSWRSAIINCSTGTESQQLRLFLNKCFAIFEKEGLSELWANYRKEILPDSTIKLLVK